MNVRSLILECLIQHHVYKPNNRCLVSDFFKNLQCFRGIFLRFGVRFFLKPIRSAHGLDQFVKAFGIGILVINQLGDRQWIRNAQLQRAFELIGQVIQRSGIQGISHAQVQRFPIQTNRQTLIILRHIHRNQLQ